MKLGASALLGFLLAVASPGADAFSVHRHTPTTLVQQTLAQVQQKQQQASETGGGWRSPLQMVAGGAEKAYGEDYYDGAFLVSLLPLNQKATRFWESLSDLLLASVFGMLFCGFFVGETHSPQETGDLPLSLQIELTHTCLSLSLSLFHECASYPNRLFPICSAHHPSPV